MVNSQTLYLNQVSTQEITLISTGHAHLWKTIDKTLKDDIFNRYAAVCDEQCMHHGGVCDNRVCEFRCSDYVGYICRNNSLHTVTRQQHTACNI